MMEQFQKAIKELDHVLTAGRNPLMDRMEMTITVSPENYTRFQKEFGKWMLSQNAFGLGLDEIATRQKVSITFPFGPTVTIQSKENG